MEFPTRKIDQSVRLERKQKKWRQAVAVLECLLITASFCIAGSDAISSGYYASVRPQAVFESVADSGSRGAKTDTGCADGKSSCQITVRADAPVGAFPAGTVMRVRSVAGDKIREAVRSVIPHPENIVRIHAVDIAFFDVRGNEIEPDKKVKVSLTTADIPACRNPVVVHVNDAGSAEIVKAKKENENIVFESDRFSAYAIVETTEQYVLTSDGYGYHVSVTCGPDAGIPEDAELIVDEITEDGPYEAAAEYAACLGKIRETLGLDTEADFEYLRLLDIRIVDGNGEKIEIAAPVEVKIGLADREEDRDLNVVHFADGEETGDVLENIEITGPEESGGGSAVSFEADGFSVYALVEAHEPPVTEIEYVTGTDELTDGIPFLLSYNGVSRYFTNTLNGNSAFTETEFFSDAAEWYFENADGDGKYRLYTYTDGRKQYLKNTGGNLAGLGDPPGSVLELIPADGNKFYIKLDGANKWLQHSNGGGGIRFWTDNNNVANSQISVTYASSYVLEDDPYRLDGTAVGIVYDSGSLFCTALMQGGDSGESVAAEDLVTLDTKGYEDNLFVPVDSDITEWTFTNVEEDMYYITAGDGKYLTVTDGAVVLGDSPSEDSLIQVVPGTGSRAGFYSFTANGHTLAMTGEEEDRGFTGIGNRTGKIWFKLAERSALSEDDYLICSAKKIRVSDPASEVVLYTRVWNGTAYEFYAVDYDGSLIRCYDEGDLIKWVGSRYQTAVWELTEHTKNDGQGGSEPNGYYELKNTYSGLYINPKMGDAPLFSDKETFLNLDGRYYQEDYTKIRCWDDTYYAYIGLKADPENRRVVPCPSSQADDFYFARIKDTPVRLTEVPTIDNNEFGITMKMIDFNNPVVNGRDSGQTAFFGKDSDRPGLLTTDIDEASGYPVSVHNHTSLGELYNGGTTVNHLFVRSVYDESGYFEYDSTKNYAYLADSEFRVYDQLGTIEREDKPTMYHGQFMPYNPLTDPSTGEPWPYSDRFTNTRDITGALLPEDDPRYGEGLHEIPKSVADYFFGMEMSASFVQTFNGLDAWGHDIIFEFSGDDDFWLYVDGELILDLGGVHSAMSGSVNFRTGTVTGRNGTRRTLRQIFESNYRARNPHATAEDVNRYLLQYFEEGGTIFRPYSTHRMNIYYMERGAGASNLHMRFNLAAVRPGEVNLSKKVTGSDDIDYDLMEFPYRILYRTQENINAGDISWTALIQDSNDPVVTYRGSQRPVRFARSFTPVGSTDSLENVFFLRPGETASIALPPDTEDYKIVECGVNMDIFRSVKANGELLSREGDTGRHDYATSGAAVKDRTEVEFENEVDPDSLRTLTVTKVLWDEGGFTVTGQDGETVKQGNRLNGYEPDSTVFDFRISMSPQGSSLMTPVRNKEYFVKDDENNYCRWDPVAQRFVSLGIGNYAELAQYLGSLSDAERTSVVFETSNNGAVSRIPGGFSVEFRGLPVDSSFRVTEREDEIPAGYSLVEYERDRGSYISEEEPNQGTIRANENPHILVHNRRGWGLTVRKDWSDADYMESHDDIYIAVYIDKPGGQGPVLVNGTLQRLRSPSVTHYYYFNELEEGASFDDYRVYEVLLTDPHCDSDGSVISCSGIERIPEGGTLTAGGTPKGKTHQDGYAYKVNYAKGTAAGSGEGISNVRTDTISNIRQGIRLVKTDWNGEPLSGAVFALKDSDGTPVGADSYTSGADGLITVAYLDPGITYTLEETDAPNGFHKPNDAWSVTVEGNTVNVSGDEGSFAVEYPEDGGTATVTLKNKGFSLRALKTDRNNKSPLAGAVFALYKQVPTAGGMAKDRFPQEGCESLVTGPDGVIPGITSSLKEGTYYLSEVSPPPGYKALQGDLVFTIGKNGVVEIPSHVVSGDSAGTDILNNNTDIAVTDWIGTEEDEGHLTYTINIPNEAEGIPVRILKTDRSGNPVAGAEFSLLGNGINEEGLVSAIRTIPGQEGEQGDITEALVYENMAFPTGTYILTETKVPAGYKGPEGDITISVQMTPEGSVVTAQTGGSETGNPAVSQDTATGVWTVRVMNDRKTSPETGGPGRRFIYCMGVLLAVIFGAGLFMTKRQKN